MRIAAAVVLGHGAKSTNAIGVCRNLVLVSGAMGPWPLDPRGPQAEQISTLYWIMFICAVVVLGIVTGALVYSGVKFRERPGHVEVGEPRLAYS